MAIQDKGILVNFRSNVISGNKKDAREDMRIYGETDFFFDYAQYLESLYEYKPLELGDLQQVSAIFKYIA